MSTTGSLPYVPYLNLVATIGCVICRVVTIYTMSKVVYHRFRGSNTYPRVRIVSPMVIMFLSISVCCALTTLPYYLYTMVKWSPGMFGMDVARTCPQSLRPIPFEKLKLSGVLYVETREFEY
ncbi:hypothetical protein DdX_20271 [Ditylenchus destructor]|uniref:Uncharacterized protein n=1 Tax=Ditylenchus destructor TaxID=166010 RepID=A0AAD4MIB5_9BILA|nr:hypothetical protein DdX_20271 [Ditylenchus destructor]